MHRGQLPFAAGPGPVRKDMGLRHFRCPAGLVQPVAVFGEAGQVDDAEIRTPGRQGNVTHGHAPAFQHLPVSFLFFFRVEIGEHRRVHVKGRGFANIVVTGPDKFAGTLRNSIFVLPLIIRLGGPAGGIQVVGTYLEGGAHVPALAFVLLYREAVIPARRDAGSRFAAQEGLAGMLVTESLVQMGLVVEAIHIQGGGIRLGGSPGVVVAGRGGAGGIFAVANIGEHLGNPPAGAVALFAAFVADTPEDHGRMVAVAADHGHEVFFGPFLKEGGVAVLLLGPGPGVGEFVHHQQAHAVAEVQQFRCRRIVGAADGVAAHLLKHFQAAHPGIFVPHSA